MKFKKMKIIICVNFLLNFLCGLKTFKVTVVMYFYLKVINLLHISPILYAWFCYVIYWCIFLFKIYIKKMYLNV